MRCLKVWELLQQCGVSLADGVHSHGRLSFQLTRAVESGTVSTLIVVAGGGTGMIMLTAAMMTMIFMETSKTTSCIIL